jgi:hypothetical protein
VPQFIFMWMGHASTPKSVTNLVKFMHKQERLLEHALAISPTRLSRYCRPIDPAFVQRLEAHRSKTMQELKQAWYGDQITQPSRYHQSRYHGLNLNSLFFRGTIEFRLGEVKACLLGLIGDASSSR